MATPDTTLDGARDDDPLRWFQAAFAEAQASEAFDPCQAALATVDADGMPQVRYVLVKDVSPAGFAFYTNLDSPKAVQLQARPRAALAFHWHSLSLQVRVEGAVTPVSEAESDSYFSSRPRQSQLGAWASRQSQPVADRSALEAAFDAVAERFPAGTPVPRPPRWGGLRIAAARVEFWLSRDGRLHDRWRFERGESGRYQRIRLQP